MSLDHAATLPARAPYPSPARGSPHESHTQLQGRRLALARAVWLLVFFSFNGLFLADIPRRYAFVIQLSQSRPSWQQLSFGADRIASFYVAFDVFCMLAFSFVAALTFWRKSSDGMAIYVSLALITYPVIGTFVWFTIGETIAGNGLLTFLECVGIGLSLIFYFIFPSGQFVPPWTRLLTIAYVAWCITWFVYPPLNPAGWPPPFPILAFGMSYLIGVLAQLYRYRHRANPVQRQQTKWVVFGTAVISLGITLLEIFRVLVSHQLNELAQAQIDLVSIPGIVALQLFVPATFGVAILHYHLYDIDIILNRTLVYVPLTAILAGVYTASVTLTSKLLVASTSPGMEAPTALATLIVVVAFSPVKDVLQKLVDRGFKEAPDPERKLAAFARQVHTRISAVQPDQVTRRLLEEAVAAYGAHGGLALREQDGAPRTLLSLGEWNGQESLTVPVKGRGTSYARIALAARRDAREYTPHDREVLMAVAGEIAAAIEQDSAGI